MTPLNERTLAAYLIWMKSAGSSVLLNWAEDDDLWECSWITGGVRHTGRSKDLVRSVMGCLHKAGALREAAEAVGGTE